MKSLQPILTLWRLAWWRRALREMGADHPDAPCAILRIAELERTMP